MTNLIDASNSYQANATAFTASKDIASRGLQMGQQ
jgi:flagellar basal-body rod protein FlgC